MESRDEKYNSAIGLEVEFVRDKDYNLGEIKKELQKVLGVKIKLEKESHSDFVPTFDHYKMEPDFSAGDHSVEIVTPPLEYSDSRIVLMKILKWIRGNEKVKTNDRCGLHININYPNDDYIQNIDVLKFILLFDEEEIYTRFPERRDNLYTRSIKEITPLHSNFDFNNPNLNRKNFIYPNTKYYGINFSKLKDNYLEFRYLGGKDYEKKQEDILYLIDFFVKSLPEIYKANDDKLNDYLSEIMENKKSLFLAGQSYFNFKNIFKNIEILVDTDKNEEVLKLFFPIIWKEIFPILLKMKEIKFNMKGTINYDTDLSKIEMSSFILRRTIIENPRVLFYDCKILNTALIKVELHYCSISGSDLLGVKSDNTKFLNSRIKDGNQTYSEFIKCYLDGLVELDQCTVEGGIFRNGKYKDTEISDSTNTIDAEEIEEEN